MSQVQGSPNQQHLQAIRNCGISTDANNSGQLIFTWEVFHREGEPFKEKELALLESDVVGLPHRGPLSAEKLRADDFIRDPVFQKGDVVQFRLVNPRERTSLSYRDSNLQVVDLSQDTDPPCKKVNARKARNYSQLDFFQHRFNFTGWKVLEFRGKKPGGRLYYGPIYYEVLFIRVLNRKDFEEFAKAEREKYLNERRPELVRQRRTAKKIRQLVEWITNMVNSEIRQGRRNIGHLLLPDHRLLQGLRKKLRKKWGRHQLQLFDESLIAYQISKIHAISGRPFPNWPRCGLSASRSGGEIEVQFLHTRRLPGGSIGTHRYLTKSLRFERYAYNDLVVAEHQGERIVLRGEDLLKLQAKAAIEAVLLLADFLTVGRISFTRKVVMKIGTFFRVGGRRLGKRMLKKRFRKRFASGLQRLRRTATAGVGRFAQLGGLKTAERKAVEALVRQLSRQLLQTATQTLTAAISTSIQSVVNQATQLRKASASTLQSRGVQESRLVPAGTEIDWSRVRKKAAQSMAITWRNAGLDMLLRFLPARNWFEDLVSQTAIEFVKEVLNRNPNAISLNKHSKHQIDPNTLNTAAWSAAETTFKDKIEGAISNGTLSSWIGGSVARSRR